MSGITVALVGIGGYGEFYARALLEGGSRHNVSFAAVVDPAPGRCSIRNEIAASGVPFFSGLEEMYARMAPDLLVLATPIHLHAAQAIMGLARGSHVLCEKPVAATVQEALAMLDAERRSGGRFLAVGFQWSFSEAVHALKSDIRAGLLGRPLRLKTMTQWPRDSAYYGRNNWAGRIKDGNGAWILDSPLSNATSHYLHNMFYLIGREERLGAAPVSVEFELYRVNPIENYDTAALRIVADVGAEMLFLTTHACQSGVGPVSAFEFEDAVVTYSENLDGVFRVRFANGLTRDYGRPSAQPDRKLWLCADAVRGGDAVPCGVEAALPHLVCVNAVQEVPAAVSQVPVAFTGQRVTDGGGTLRWINGAGDLFWLCFERGLLPSELGHIQWAAPARKVNVAGYRRFPSAEREGGVP